MYLGPKVIWAPSTYMKNTIYLLRPLAPAVFASFCWCPRDKVLLGYLREMGHINELSWFPMRVLWSYSWKMFIFFVLYKAALRAWWYCSKTSGSTDAKQW